MAREPLAAEITLDDLEGYRKDIESVTKEAVGTFERRCREAIAAEGGSFDDESIDRIRDEVAGLMEDCVGAYGDATQSIASRMFEDVLERQGEPDDVPMAGIDFSKRAKASARQWAGLLFRDPPDVEGFVNGASSFVERHVRHSADYCVLEAANGRKFRKRIRYARVPSGPSCGFCIMLASRGFVYASEETAGAFSKFHTGCNCSVIAGYEGLKVAGYDYDGMYERYEACRKALGTPEDVWREFERLPLEEKDRYGGARLAKIDEMPRSLIEQIGSNADNFNDYYAHRIAAEMDRRDRRWLYDGTVPKVDDSLKSFELLEEHEKAGVKKLLSNGVNVKLLLEDPEAAANFDFEVMGVPWEMKNVSNSKSSVSNQIKRARVKWVKLGKSDEMRVVITAEGCSDSRADVIAAVDKRLRDGEEAVIVFDEKTIRRLTH